MQCNMGAWPPTLIGAAPRPEPPSPAATATKTAPARLAGVTSMTSGVLSLSRSPAAAAPTSPPGPGAP
eukprot:1812716-Lingulodinium_polyedra.AAC.1